MLDRLNKLIRAFTPDARAKADPAFDEDDHRVAAAALLVHAANVDGVQTEAERLKLEALLQDRFALDPAETRALIRAADARDKEAVDFHAFIGTVKRAYDAEGRKRLVEMMWEIAFADGTVHPFEDDMVWRVAELLTVPSRERIAIRKRLAAAHGLTVADDAG